MTELASDPSAGLLCPACTVGRMNVADTRPVDANAIIRRRRLCENCGHRITTYEIEGEALKGNRNVVSRLLNIERAMLDVVHLINALRVGIPNVGDNPRAVRDYSADDGGDVRDVVG